MTRWELIERRRMGSPWREQPSPTASPGARTSSMGSEGGERTGPWGREEMYGLRGGARE